MPFECAKAMAATFCYEIRHLLTPIFGKDFMKQCRHPSEPGFPNFTIDPAIIESCTVEVNERKARLAQGSPTGIIAPIMSPMVSPKSVPNTPFLQGITRPKRRGSLFSPGMDSGYLSDPYSDSTSVVDSPQVSPKTRISNWTPVNRDSHTPDPITSHPKDAAPSTPITSARAKTKTRKRKPPIQSVTSSPTPGLTFTERGVDSLKKIEYVLSDDEGPKARDKLRRFPHPPSKDDSKDQRVGDTDNGPRVSSEVKAAADILLSIKNSSATEFEDAIAAQYKAVLGHNPSHSNEKVSTAIKLVAFKTGPRIFGVHETSPPSSTLLSGKPSCHGLGIHISDTVPDAVTQITSPPPARPGDTHCHNSALDPGATNLKIPDNRSGHGQSSTPDDSMPMEGIVESRPNRKKRHNVDFDVRAKKIKRRRSM